MTLVNAWHAAQPEREMVFWLCDGCDPPRPFVGALATGHEVGWQTGAGADGPHFCPWCRSASRAEGRRVPVSPSPALPNLLIIGAAKAGTTSLHHYLSLHPEISMAEGKELHFFARDGDPDQYATHFDGRRPVRGEASPTYTFAPIVGGVPARIRRTLADVKLVYLVRDPIERAVGSYVEGTSQGWEPLPITRAMSDPTDPLNPHTAQSNYGSQLERYLEAFDRESILVIDQAELAVDRRGVLARVFEFAGADPSYWTDEFDHRLNTRETKWQRTRFGQRLRRTRAAKIVRRLPPGPRDAIIDQARRLTRSRVEREPELDAATRERLAEAFEIELVKLERLAGIRPSGVNRPAQRPATGSAL